LSFFDGEKSCLRNVPHDRENALLYSLCTPCTAVFPNHTFSNAPTNHQSRDVLPETSRLTPCRELRSHFFVVNIVR